jgi:hypothetical protein
MFRSDLSDTAKNPSVDHQVSTVILYALYAYGGMYMKTSAHGISQITMVRVHP